MRVINYLIIAMVFMLCSCKKIIEENKSGKSNVKNIPDFLAGMAKEYSSQINAVTDHIDDTLIFRLQSPPAFVSTFEAFKQNYIDHIAQGIGKNVYLGFTGDYSDDWLYMPNGRLVSPANLGNLYFYIYSDFYELDPDSFYSLINVRFLYNLTEPPFK